MAQAHFGLTYKGPALADGHMPVRDLAPALLALGELFTEASVLLRPDHPPVSLEIKATQEGSFIVDLILQSESPWNQLVDMLGSEDVTALLKLKELILGGVGLLGLFGLIKRQQGKSIEREEGIDPGHVRLTFDDETSVDVPTEVAALHRKVSVRKKAQSVVQPLARPGVNEIEFRSDKEVTLSIEKADLPAYEAPGGEEEPLTDVEHEMVLQIASVAFIEGNKWRFSDGDQTFFAELLDDAFLHRVDMGEAFRKGDMLRCRVRLSQVTRRGELHTERSVLEVIKHIPSGEQLPLGPGGEVGAG